MKTKISFTKKGILSFLFIFLLTVNLSSNSAVKKLPNFYDDLPNEKLAAEIIANMTDEELLAQTFMFGWAGQDPGDLLLSWIEDSGLGSIKVFGWNTGDSHKLAKAISLLQKKSLQGRFGIPLFVATDQEGGWVRHVKGLTSETPGNLAIGASGIPWDSYYSGYYISREISALGINLNFAPTVDLLTDHDSSIIGPRSFGDSPHAAGILGAAFVRGSREAGVLTTAKHFPGHGDTSIDSHGRLPKIDISEETFRNRELIPFKYLIEAGVPAIMTGHLNFSSILPNGEPATFSKYLLTDILRGEMGFKGLIITDDMMMHGAMNFAGGIAKAVKMALEAGNDIIESSTTPRHYQAFWKENIRAMKDDPEFKERVKDAAFRIIYEKLKYFKSNNHVPILPELEKLDERIPDKEGQKFFLSLAGRSTTIVRDAAIPFKPEPNEDILLVSAYKDFFKYGLKRFPDAKIIEVDSARHHARRFDTIIFCLSDKYSLGVLKKIMESYPQKKYIVISILSPAFLAKVPDVQTAIAIYSYSPASFTAAFGALCGDFNPNGKLPISGVK
ncbi:MULTISPECIES: glycoside hydrolase family 3 protein [unclassified Treponema]|uniref:glycoside hydrolase family 3 protein n=1 Tax=unclassified Treponema TaxID=2638727 RepID=UPI0020A2BD0B|nr:MULTISPECIES: glycoside hydrolase family 3 protein [unclassified Treponema]UTC67068.1 glycoside hydrolase family 3 protein [Treponema sp. OMZ 789]UTC69799.1 glycoside hydrolase family 3 protein [Treponema sp. OMZ 790]UTC72513.1 glycoside hydrolase family 3 protein [Treponema sp. OMZ 791]